MKFALIYPVPFLDSVPIVQSLALTIANEGNSVDVYVVEAGLENNSPIINHSHIKIYQYSQPDFFKNNYFFNFTPRNLIFYYWVRNAIKLKKYDHVVGVDPAGLAIAGFICLFNKLKFSYLSLELILWKDSNRMYRGYKLLESFFIKKSRKIIVQDLLRLNLLRLEYNLNPKKFELFPNSPVGDANRKKTFWLHDKLNLRHSTKIILYMGSWTDEFNKNWIMDLADKDIGDAVIVVQNRNNVKVSESPISKNIIFFDYPLNYSDLYKLISSASLGLAFYDSNISPNIKYVGKSSGKLTHYLYHGVPVICNSLPYWQESLNYFNSGLCADSPDELYTSVHKMLDDTSIFIDGAILHFQTDLKITFSSSLLID